jgi:hypothetical protein
MAALYFLRGIPGIYTHVPRKLGKRAYASNTRGLQASGVEAGVAGGKSRTADISARIKRIPPRHRCQIKDSESYIEGGIAFGPSAAEDAGQRKNYPILPGASPTHDLRSVTAPNYDNRASKVSEYLGMRHRDKRPEYALNNI